MLETIGAGPALERARFPRVRRISVRWEEETLREEPDGRGMLVDRGSFDSLLLRHARDCGVRVFQPASVSLLDRRRGGWRIIVRGVEGETVLDARLVADATGRQGSLPRRRRRTGPKTVALHAYWHGADLPPIPRIEAGRAHWCWGVPLPDGVYNTLVFVDPRDLQRRPGTLEEKFHHLLGASTLLDRLGRARQLGPVRATDATPYIDEDCVTEDSIKVGDAALALDPLSSSGVQKAVQSALAGAVVVNTLLHRPASRGLALKFYRDSLRDASLRHAAWARSHYARAACREPGGFWRDRAEPAPPLEPIPSRSESNMPVDAPLRLAPYVEIVELPCVVDRFIESRPAVSTPRLEQPVAFLGGRELAQLLGDVRRGVSLDGLVRSWLTRMPAQEGWAVARWLAARGLLVPDEEMVSVQAGGQP